MLHENPYQSPLQAAAGEPPIAELANFYRYPTWRFWLLAVAVLPGIASLWLVGEIASQHNDRGGGAKGVRNLFQ